MTAANNPGWTPYAAAPVAVDADEAPGPESPVEVGQDTERSAENDGAGDGTTLRTPPLGWTILNGGRTGHTEDGTAVTPHSTPAGVAEEAPATPPAAPAGPEPVQEPLAAPKRPLREVLVDLYGNPMDAFAKAQPAISERIAYAETAPWTKAKGPLRNLGIAYNRAIGNPGVATGYLYSEIHARPAHWVSTAILTTSWHLTMHSFEWNLIWGWTLTGIAWWFSIAVIAYVVGKRPPGTFGADSGPD